MPVHFLKKHPHNHVKTLSDCPIGVFFFFCPFYCPCHCASILPTSVHVFQRILSDSTKSYVRTYNILLEQKIICKTRNYIVDVTFGRAGVIVVELIVSLGCIIMSHFT